MKLKKKKGNIHKFGIPVFTMVAVFVLVIMFVSYLGDIDKKDGVDLVAREYLLRMETEGYLNATDEAELYKDLTAKGMKNVSIIGTTRNKVGYGNKITLAITGDLTISGFNVVDVFNIKEVPKTININIKKSSTAKY